MSIATRMELEGGVYRHRVGARCAAQAIVHGARVVTKILGDFADIVGLEADPW